MPTRLPRIALLLGLLGAVGCGGPATVSQRLVGEWVGRPETAGERTLREWPGGGGVDGTLDPDDPEIAAAVASAPATDLERTGPVAIRMTLGPLGAAQMSLDGSQQRDGTWTITPLEGRRAQLEIAVEGDTETIRRRFDLLFLREGEGFVLSESGADPRFGRLLFVRPDASSAASVGG